MTPWLPSTGDGWTVAEMINLAVKPLAELEAARELAETLLQDHNGLLPVELSVQLSSLLGDLTVVIDEHYGIFDDAEAEV
jgi:hypothetical protein